MIWKENGAKNEDGFLPNKLTSKTLTAILTEVVDAGVLNFLCFLAGRKINLNPN